MENKEFKIVCFQGLKDKGLDSQQEYIDRLEKEISVITRMGFVDYFMIVADICKFCKDNGILVGFARGSCAGSLLAYCLDITKVDPLKYGLYFERFLNSGRAGRPKYDLDLEITNNQTIPIGEEYQYLLSISNNPEINILSFANDLTNTIHHYFTNNKKVSTNHSSSHLLYELGITSVPPQYPEVLLYKGVFPDIDMDFQDDRRGEVVRYLMSKYGEENIGQIGTFGTMKAKGAIRDTTRALGFDYVKGDQLAKLTLPAISGKEQDLTTSIEMVPELQELIKTDPDSKRIIELAQKLEGTIRNIGTHAAGVVISDNPLYEHIPITINKNNFISTQVDMDDVEDIGLIKFDILGLKTLTIISKCLELIKTNRNQDIDIYNDIPFDDPAIFDALSNGDTTGVFQFTGSAGISELCQKYRPYTIDDLAIITSIYRPGPISLNLPQYLSEINNGLREPEYPIPELEPILEKTKSGLVFQESIMEIATELAGFTMNEAVFFLKGVAKKKKEILEKYKKQFITGMTGNGFSQKDAEKLFGDIEGFASYCFNKCIAGDTEIISCNGPITIKDLFKYKTIFLPKILCLDSNGRNSMRPVKNVMYSGNKDVYRITLESGRFVKATADHRFLDANRQWKTVRELEVGDKVSVANGIRVEVSSIVSKIVSIEYIGMEPTYDIEMDTPEHNFIANSFVSHNSHAISYSILSYITSYLKIYYRPEFLAACLTVDFDNPEDVRKYISHAKEHSIPILPPDINRSMSEFSVDNNSIIYGLSAIKNLGQSAALEIIKERETNGPFQDTIDFCERLNNSNGEKTSFVLNKRKLEALILSGCFDNTNHDRKTLLNSLEIIYHYQSELQKFQRKSNTFSKRMTAYKEREEEINKGFKKKSLKKPHKPHCPLPPTIVKSNIPLSLVEKLKYEKELLNFYISGHILDCITKNNNNAIPLSQVSKKECFVYAVPSLVKEITTRKKKEKMAFVELADETDFIFNTVCFARTWNKYKPFIEENIPALFTLKNKNIVQVSPVPIAIEKEKIEKLTIPANHLDEFIEYIRSNNKKDISNKLDLIIDHGSYQMKMRLDHIGCPISILLWRFRDQNS